MKMKIPSQPQIVPLEGAASAAIIVVWCLGAMLVGMSWFGTYIPLAVGWQGALGGLRPSWDQTAILYSVGYQVIASVLQWGALAMYKRTQSGNWLLIYFCALATSAVPSYLTYWGGSGAWLTQQVGGEPWAARVVMGLMVLGGDWLPEKIFLATGRGSGGRL